MEKKINKMEKFWPMTKIDSKFQNIFDNIEHPIYISDPETYEILYANNVLKILFQNELVGEKCYEVLQNNREICSFCTNDKLFGEKSISAYTWDYHNEKLGRWYRCIDQAIDWEDNRKVRFEMAIDITDQKQNELNLAKSQENLNTILSSLKDPLLVIASDNKILFSNQNAEEIFGKDIIGKYCYEIIKGNDRECDICPKKKIKEKELCLTRYEQCVDSTVFDETQYFDVIYSQTGNYAGKPAIIALFRNITENRNIRNELKKSERNYKQLSKEFEMILDSIPGLVFYKDDKNNLIRVNKYFADAHKVTKSELEGKSCFDIYPKEEAQKYMDDDLEVIKSGKPKINIEEPWETESGKAWVSTSKIPYIDENDETKGIIGISLDITGRKIAEQKIRESERWLSTTLKSIGDAVIATDNQSNIRFMNSIAEELTGWGFNEIKNKVLNDIFKIFNEKTGKKAENPVDRVLREGNIIGLANHTILISKNGTKRNIADSGAPIKDIDGNVIGVVLVFRDVSEEYQMRQRIDDSEKKYRQSSKELEIIMDSIPGLIFYKDSQNNFIRVNKYVADAHKLTKEEIEGKSCFDLYPKEQAQAYWDDDLDVIKNKKSKLNIEEPWETEAGKAWVSTSKIPYIDEKGEVRGIIGVSMDVTYRKQAEQQIINQNKILNAINEIFQKTLFAKNEEELADLCLEMAQKLVGAKFGFFGEINKIGKFDTLAISNPGWDACKVPKDQARLIIKDMEIRGMQFLTLKDGISRIFNNPKEHPESVGVPEGHPEITCLLTVPFKYKGEIFGQIGLGNKEGGFLEEDKKSIELLSIAIVEVLMKIRAELDVIKYREHLEDLIEERTKELTYSEKKYRNMIQNLQVGFYNVTLDGKLINHNMSFNKILGFDPEENLNGTNLPDFWQDPQDREIYKQELIRNGYIRNFVIKAKKQNDEKIIVNANSHIVLDLEGKPNRIEGTFSDITKEYELERKLIESEFNFRTIFENSPVALWDEDFSLVKEFLDKLKDTGVKDIKEYLDKNIEVLDKIFRLVKINDINNSTLKMFGANTKEEIIDNLNLIFTNERMNTFKEELIQLNKGETLYESETTVYTLSRELKYIIARLVIVPGYEQNWGKILVSTADITKRKNTELELKLIMEDLRRSNAELEQFAYVASHDLQEPLRMVASFTQLLQRRYSDKLDEDANDFINFAVDGATRMQNLINDLLIFSRVGTRGKPFKETDMNRVLKAVLNNLRYSIEKENALITSDPLPVIIADESQMIQLIQNLISNAIKFHGDKPPEIHVSGEVKKKEWIFSVKDNGIGIDAQYFERIFIIFQRLHKKSEYGGTGIGLAVCKKIVTRHGGKIWVESELGKGSTFYFSITRES